MSLKDDLLPLVDNLRSIAGELGFRDYEVYVRTVTYAGPRMGPGAQSVSETRLLVGGQNPRVKEVHRNALAAGASEFVDAEYDIGPLTPEFASGGISNSLINPERSPSTVVSFVLKGPGLPADGLLCQRVADHLDRPLRIMIRVRSTGRKRPV